MRWISLGVTTLALVLASLGPAVSAQADSGPRFKIRVDRHAVRGGEMLTATATATTSCTWVLEWSGARRVGHGDAFETSFVAPVVSRPTRILLHGTCFYTDPRPANSSAGGNFVVSVPPSWRHDVGITVLPPGASVSPPQAAGGPGHAGGSGGGLSGTGGPALAALLAGLVLVVTGSLLVRRASPTPAA